MSSYERERYVELSKVANEQAMDLGAMHSAVKRVVSLWNDIDPVSLRGIGDEDQEHVNAERMAEAIGRLEAELMKQQAELEERERAGHGFVADSGTGRCSVCDHVKELHTL